MPLSIFSAYRPLRRLPPEKGIAELFPGDRPARNRGALFSWRRGLGLKVGSSAAAYQSRILSEYEKRHGTDTTVARNGAGPSASEERSIATSLGLEVTFTPDVLEAAQTVSQLVPTGTPRLTPGAAFAPELTSSSDNPLDEIVAHLGRSPHWPN